MNLLKNKEFKNAGWIIGGRIVQMLLSMVVGILTARFLGPSKYGIINYAMAYVTFFTSLCTLGINSVIIKDFVDHKDEQGIAIGTSLILQFVSSILSSVMIIGLVSVIDRNEPLTIAVTALCSIALIFNVFESIKYWFQSQYQSKISSSAILLAYVTVSAYKLNLLVLHKDVRWFALAASVDYIFVAIFLLVSYRKYNGPKLRFSWVKAKSLLGKSYHYILSGLMVAIYGQTDKLMLKKLLNEYEVGYYSVATAICTMWVFILQAIIDSVYPTIMKLHGENKSAFERKNRQLYTVIFYVSIAVSVCFLILGSFIVRILYGADYVHAINPLKIVTWYTAFSYLGVARNAWIVCENKQKYLKYMYFSAAIMNVGLNFIFIPLWGASGAALASLSTELFACIVIPLLIKEMRPNAKLMVQAILLKDLIKKRGKISLD